MRRLLKRLWDLRPMTVGKHLRYVQRMEEFYGARMQEIIEVKRKLATLLHAARLRAIDAQRQMMEESDKLMARLRGEEVRRTRVTEELELERVKRSSLVRTAEIHETIIGVLATKYGERDGEGFTFIVTDSEMARSSRAVVFSQQHDDAIKATRIRVWLKGSRPHDFYYDHPVMRKMFGE